MGTIRTDYIILGVDIKEHETPFEYFQAEIEGAPGARFDIIKDWMCDKFKFAGKVLATSDTYDGFEITDIDAEDSKVDCLNLCHAINTALGSNFETQQFRVYAVSVFS